MVDALIELWRHPDSILPGTIVEVEGSGEEMIVIGPTDPEESSQVVVGLDSQEAGLRYAGELIPIGELGSDPGSFAFASWEILAYASIPESVWLFKERPAPPLAGWHLFVTTALARYYRLRAAGAVDLGEPKAVFKELLQRVKACEAEDRAKLAAMVPELVNPSRRGHPSLKTLDEGTVLSLSTRLCELSHLLAAELEAMAPRPASDAPSSHPPDSAAEQPVAAPPPPASPKPRQPRVLRAKIHHRDLLALEWPLAPVPGAFSEAIRTTLAWLGQRLGTELPAHWSDGVHEIELGGVRLEVAANDRVFAMRLEHPDGAEVARTWRMEATVVSSDSDSGMVGLRLSTLDRLELPPAPRTIPALVHAWREAPGLAVAEGVAETLPIDSTMAFFRLRNEVKDPARRHVIWAFHAGDVSAFAKVPALVQQCAVSPAFVDDYSSKLRPLEAGTWHVYGRGQAAPFVHPVKDAGRHIHGMVTAACEVHGSGPRFRDVLDFSRQSLQQERELYRRTVTEREAVEPAPAPVFISATADLQRQLDHAIGDAEASRSELEQALRQIKRLKARLRAFGGPSGDAEDDDDAGSVVDAPAALSALPEWIETIAPRVQFADKAVRFASKIDHTDTARIYACLQALHDDYWAMLWGEDSGAKDRWESFLAENRLDFGRVGAAIDNHRFADTYQAIVAGKRVTMDMHVRGNSGRDPRRCLRIYLHADMDRKIVCVGHLPTHLDNTLT